MPKRPPPLPDADDLPEIEADEGFDADLPVDLGPSERMSAEADVSETLEDISVQSFEDIRGQEPLDFQDGGDMGR